MKKYNKDGLTIKEFVSQLVARDMHKSNVLKEIFLTDEWFPSVKDVILWNIDFTAEHIIAGDSNKNTSRIIKDYVISQKPEDDNFLKISGELYLEANDYWYDRDGRETMRQSRKQGQCLLASVLAYTDFLKNINSDTVRNICVNNYITSDKYDCEEFIEIIPLKIDQLIKQNESLPYTKLQNLDTSMLDSLIDKIKNLESRIKILEDKRLTVEYDTTGHVVSCK